MRTVRLNLELADLVALRWAISPAWELTSAARTLVDPTSYAIHLPWLSAHHNDPGLRDGTVLRALVGRRGTPLPGFLAPTPSTPIRRIEDELREVAATPVATVRSELQHTFRDGLPPELAPIWRAPRRGMIRIAEELQSFWNRALAPSWPRLRTLLESDIQHRAAVLTDRGPEAMLDAIHTSVRWDPGRSALEIADRRMPDLRDRTLDGRGLVLVPSAFAWPDVFFKTAGPWTPVLRYPVRGVGTLWHGEPPAPGDLTAALGKTRTEILQSLESPMATRQLADQLGMAPGGVSMQLKKLAAAGLVTSQRIGKSVLYARTTRGDALFD